MTSPDALSTSKMRQVRAALSGLVIEGATEPGHALLDAAAHF